jgi:hypothetical protein
MRPEDKIAKRINELLERSKGSWVDDSDIYAFGINVATLIRSLMGAHHPLTKDVDTILSTYSSSVSRSYFLPLQKVIGALAAIKSDYEGGYLIDLRTVIRSEVEADFLGQALQLLDEKYKDSAAMLIGAVLEDALRQLCCKHTIPERDGIEKMNAPLRTAGVYGLPQQQQITAWASIRNKAAHGKFNEYSIEEVRLMHQGVSDFILKYLST